ncbi:MAG: 4-amino-4-deoxy-L-arabinose-phosphoundecaprenol flippase subunit ArnF [Solirubrobacteraceae bacterium]
MRASEQLKGYGFVLATILLTSYGQIVFKWRLEHTGDWPAGAWGKVELMVRFLVNPWIVSVGLAVAAAAICWAATLNYFELSHAYPLMSLTYVLVVLLAGVFFSEAVTTLKVLGVALVCLGVAVGSQG